MSFYGSKTFEDLQFALSNDIGNSLSIRVIVPVTHIYIEHIMVMLLNNKYPDSKKFLANRKNGFSEKVHKLAELHLLSFDEHHDLDVLNDMRNRIVHKLFPDLKEIHKMTFDLREHVYNSNANPVRAILDDMIMIMELLAQKIRK